MATLRRGPRLLRRQRRAQLPLRRTLVFCRCPCSRARAARPWRKPLRTFAGRCPSISASGEHTRHPDDARSSCAQRRTR
jgi:hypothetical protein